MSNTTYLLDNLKWTKEVAIELNQQKRTLQKLSKKKKNIHPTMFFTSPRRWGYWILALGYGSSLLFSAGSDDFLGNVHQQTMTLYSNLYPATDFLTGGVGPTLYMLALVMAPFVVMTTVINTASILLSAPFRATKKAIRNKKLGESKGTAKTLEQNLNNDSVLSGTPYLRDEAAITKFIQYLSSGRADTIKECIGFYEIQKDADEKLAALEQQYKKKFSDLDDMVQDEIVRSRVERDYYYDNRDSYNYEHQEPFEHYNNER